MNLSPQLYYQLTYTLTDLLPPPLDDTPAALRARNHAAIAKVAAMLPVNANEADLAAQCIVARAQAEDIMRLIRESTHDIKLLTRLNAQYVSMARMSLATHKHLMQVQAVRRKREAIEAIATQDAWTQHIAERSMMRVADPDFERLTTSPEAAREEATPAAPAQAPRAPEPAPVAAPAPQAAKENVSQCETSSHSMAFETPMSESPSNQGPDRTVMPHIEQVNAETAVATPNPPPEDAPAPIAAPAQAAPAKSAAPSAASARHPSPQPPRMANPRDGLLWADAMTAVSQEMTAGLDALPPALRKQEAMRAQLLRSVARDITARASAAGVPRRIVVVPKT